MSKREKPHYQALAAANQRASALVQRAISASRKRALNAARKQKLPPKRPKWHFVRPTQTIWILVDASNSNQRSKNYLWWFETRALARKYMDHVRQVYPDGAQLIGPYKYKFAEKPKRKKLRRGRTR